MLPSEGVAYSSQKDAMGISHAFQQVVCYLDSVPTPKIESNCVKGGSYGDIKVSERSLGWLEAHGDLFTTTKISLPL